MKRSIKRYVTAVILLTASTGMTVARADEPQDIEAEVRESLEVSLARLRVRVAKVEVALEQIKSELKRREQSVEEMITQRVAELTSGKAEDDESGDGSATNLSAEGWTAWQKQDLQTAKAKFRMALAKEPNLVAACMGWDGPN